MLALLFGNSKKKERHGQLTWLQPGHHKSAPMDELQQAGHLLLEDSADKFCQSISRVETGSRNARKKKKELIL